MTNIFVNINRRQFIKKSAIGIFIAGGALAAGKLIISPPDMDLPNPYPELPSLKPVLPPFNDKALFFNKHQYTLVAALAAIIIPTDDDPGATEAGVVDYIDIIVSRSKNKQTAYTKGLRWIDKFSHEKFGASEGFLSLTLKKQIDLLHMMDESNHIRGRRVSGFLQRVNRKFDKIWDDVFGAAGNSGFFNVIRKDVIDGYFSNPVSWTVVGYFGPPQPVGYLGFSDPPSSAEYTGSVRPVDDATCLMCHKAGKHPREGLISHACTVCHRPHSPWPYDKSGFHLEDHIEFVFPSPDRKNG